MAATGSSSTKSLPKKAKKAVAVAAAPAAAAAAPDPRRQTEQKAGQKCPAFFVFSTAYVCGGVAVAGFATHIIQGTHTDALANAAERYVFLQSVRPFGAPDIADLTFAHRLTYDIKSNWKNAVDSFLECCHCPTAHKDFCDLVDMDTYKVATHGIYSSHLADAGTTPNSAYDISNATVKTHAVWWLWPNTLSKLQTMLSGGSICWSTMQLFRSKKPWPTATTTIGTW
nr:SRPBCC family protein [Leisingera sp. MMG026]